MDSRLLSVDPLLNARTLHHYDESTGDTTIETVQDVTAIIESNKTEFNAAPGQFMRAGEEFRKVASIPMSVYYDLRKQGIAQDPERMKRWLNERDNRVFRTTPETV